MFLPLPTTNHTLLEWWVVECVRWKISLLVKDSKITDKDAAPFEHGIFALDRATRQHCASAA